MSKLIWCWRCQMRIPMLDEGEWKQVEPLLSGGFRATKEFRVEHGLPLEGLDLSQLFLPALNRYQQLTGFRETNAKALWHHRIKLFGPECPYCGRPKRTPTAAHFVDCPPSCGVQE